MCMHMCIYMTKVISLSDEAYVRMKAWKREGESFSDVVVRMEGGRRPLSDFAGIWKDIDTDSMKKEIAESRKRFRTREVRF